MPAIQFFNSAECEWADMSVTIGGAKCAKIQGIRFGSERQKEYIYGEGKDPLQIASGNKSYPGELKILKTPLDNLNTAAKAATGDPSADITDVEVDIIVTFKSKGIRVLQTITLIGCQFEKSEQGWDQGATKLEVTIPFKALRVVSL